MKKELEKLISDMLKEQDKEIKGYKTQKLSAVTVGREKEIAMAIKYSNGIKRGLLNIADKFELDLEF